MTIAYNHRGGHGVCYTVLAVSVTKTSRAAMRQSMLTDDSLCMNTSPTRCVRGEAHDVANSGDGSTARPSLCFRVSLQMAERETEVMGGRLVPSTSRVLRKFAPRDLIS